MAEFDRRISFLMRHSFQFHPTSREDPYQDADADGIGCGRPRERCVCSTAGAMLW